MRSREGAPSGSLERRRGRFGLRRGASMFALVAASVAGGCLLVAPIDDLPEPSPGVGGSDGQGGSLSGGGGVGANDDGGAGAAGDVSGSSGGQGGKGQGGQGGSAGKAGDGGSAAASGGTSGTGDAVGGAGEGGVPSGGTGGCTTNDECVKRGGGEPYRCRPSDQRCVALKSPECQLAYGDYRDPNALYFGTFATLNSQQPAENSTVWAQRLAIDEINAVDGGLPGGPDGERRPLVMVVCNNDTSKKADMIEVGMQHLAVDVRVPAVIATLQPADLVQAFEDQLARHLFFLSPVTVSRQVADTDFKDQGLVWNLLGQPSDFAPGYAKVVSELERYLRVERSLPDEVPLKVALVSTSDPFSAEVDTFLYSSLIFNGQSVALNKAANDYLGISLDLAGNVQMQVNDAFSDIFDFTPDIVISVAGEEMVKPGGIVEQLETKWKGPGHDDDPPRPYFILSPYNAGDLDNMRALIPAIMGQDPSTPGRYLGISAAAASDPTLQNEYATRLRTKFGDTAITDTGNYYDAVYYLAYAMAGAAPADQLGGPGIADGMKRLLAGPPLDMKPATIADVYAALAEEDSTVALSGTLGPPDFDAATGVRRATPSVFCFTKTSSTSTTVHPDALVYDFDTEAFTSTEPYPCLANFPVP